MKTIISIFLALCFAAAVFASSYSCPRDDCQLYNTGKTDFQGRYFFHIYRCPCCNVEYLIRQ
jgi:hypothetical protein